jgi:hypothetical protein
MPHAIDGCPWCENHFSGQPAQEMQTLESQVGIFWVVNKTLLVHGVSLAEAEDYGRFKNYPGSHKEIWQNHQRVNAVPLDAGYDAPPRGRVLFDTLNDQFVLYADQCILGDDAVMNQIRTKLHLRPETKLSRDEHYRCTECLRQAEASQSTSDKETMAVGREGAAILSHRNSAETGEG